MSEHALRVAVDARCLNTEHLRGMGKSLYELIARTAESGAIEWHLFGDRPDRPFHAPHPSCHVDVFETRGYRFAAWEQLSLPRAAQRVRADILHAPATSMPWWQPVPTAVTIHDTIPWQSNQDAHWPPGFYRDHLLPSAYHRASAIMTVSHTSRRDIVARWPALEPKLHVISPGVDQRYLEAEPSLRPIELGDRVLREPYLLYLGGADPRKRLTWALQAWWTSAEARRAAFVICGAEASSHEAIRRSVPRELQERLIIAPFIAEDVMPQLYMRATAVLYPSLYEGFGLPVIEAHAVGTPILFSDVGSLSELKGPAAVVLPVDDLAAWSRALDLIAQAAPARRGPDRIARAWAQQYSWDAYTDRTLKVYASLVKQRPAHARPVDTRTAS